MQVEDSFDELFVCKLRDYEVTPPEGGWRRIERELSNRSRNIRKYWLMAASVAMLLSVAASVVYLQTKSKTLQEPVHVAVAESGMKQQQAFEPVIADVQETAHENTTDISSPQQAIKVPIASESSGKAAVVQQVQSFPDASGKTGQESQFQSKTQPAVPVYADSWDEKSHLQPLKMSNIQPLSKKYTLNILDNPAKEPGLAVARTPVYDDTGLASIADVPAKAGKKWEIAGQFAPVYSYRAITDVPNNMNKSDFDRVESGIVAYSGGVTVAYEVVGRFSVQTGVIYSQMGQAINHLNPEYNMYAAVSSSNAYTKNIVRTSSGNISVASNVKADKNPVYNSYFNTDSRSTLTITRLDANSIAAPETYRLIERIDYLEIPLMMRYKVIDRRFNLDLLGGMSTNILIDNNVFMDNGNEIVKDGTLLMARPLNYSSTFGLALGYRINNNLLIDIEPSFKYYLKSYTTRNSVDSNPYSFGVYTGVIYRF